MYKHKNPIQREKSAELHKSEVGSRKPNFGDEPELKPKFSLESKVKSEKALGLAADSALKNGAYIQGIEADKQRHAIQLMKRRGSSKTAPPPLLPPPVIGLPPITEFSEDSVRCSPAQEARILIDPRQSPITDKDTGAHFYHIEGRYPEEGKAIWVITDDGKIKIVGLYYHVNDNYKKYKIREGKGPKHINLK